MKKFAKLFAVLFVISLITCAFALTTSAEDVNTTAPYRVGDAYCESWEAALFAAKTARADRLDPTIYLNPNFNNGVISVQEAFEIIDEDVILDMNGASVAVDSSVTGAVIISGVENKTFTVRGKGEFTNVACFVSTSNGGNFVLEGRAEGISVFTRSYEENFIAEDTKRVTKHSFIVPATIVNIGNGSSVEVSGNLTITPYNVTSCVFGCGANVEFNAIGANITVDKPASARQSLKDAAGNLAGGSTMFYIGSGNSFRAVNSHLEINYGGMFSVDADTAVKDVHAWSDGENKGTIIEDLSEYQQPEPTIFIDIDSSTLIAVEGDYTDRSELAAKTNHAIGTVLYVKNSKVYATFDNCDISASSNAFTGNTGYNLRTSESFDHDSDAATENVTGIKSAVLPAHVILNNCNYTTSGTVLATNPALISYHLNVKWNGGVIKLQKVAYSGSTPYIAESDLVASYNQAYTQLKDNGNDYDDDFYGARFSNVYFVNNTDILAWLSTTTQGRGYDFTGTRKTNVSVINAVDGTAVSYKVAYLDDDFVNPISKAPAYLNDYTVSDFTSSYDPTLPFVSDNGTVTGENVYASHFSAIDTGDGKIISNVLSENGKNGYLKVVGTAGSTYDATIDLNIRTSGSDTESKYVIKEFDIRTNPENGGYPTIDMNLGYCNSSTGKISYHWNYIDIATSGNIVVSGGEGIKSTNLASDGRWSRITLIFDISCEGTTMNTTMYVYIDGNYLTKVSYSLAASRLDRIRMYVIKGEASEVHLDNFATSVYPTTANEAALTRIADILENKKSLKGEEGFLIMPDNNILVDGKAYYSESDAVAAIKPGSRVELFKKLNTTLDVSYPMMLVTNGNDYAGFVSDSYVARVYNDISYFGKADSSEIYNVNFDATDFGVKENLTATEGSLITTAPDLDVITEPVNGNYVDGWNISLPLVATKEIAENGVITVLPKTVGAAIVTWYDSEGEKYGDAVYYKPGAGVYAVLPEGISVEKIITGNNWFDYAVSYETALAKELSAPGEYSFEPDITAVSPDGGVSDIKINLSVSTDFKLNIYIPVFTAPNEVTNIVLARDEQGENLISATETSIEANDYNKYTDIYGVAETDARSYYLIYTVGDDTVTQKINYGVPYYASAVMQKSDEEIGVKAKNLVMNMVNYAYNILKLQDSSVMESEGAQIYELLLSNFGLDSGYEYLNIYKSINAETFTNTEGSVYKTQIENLTYDDLKSYVTPSFYFSTGKPAFIFAYTDAAVAKGIRSPEIGSEGGVFLTYGFGGKAVNPATHIAYDSEGNSVDGPWGDECSSDNAYYALCQASSAEYLAVYELLAPMSVSVSVNGITKVEGTYSFAAYVKSLIDGNHTEYLDLAYSLYAYALATEDYKA